MLSLYLGIYKHKRSMIRHYIYVSLSCLFLGLFVSSMVSAQPIRRSSTTTPPVDAPTMRAVVIGVSDYRDPGIRPLKYAHLDAQAFADYLRSDAAGKIQKQIRVLTNADATLAAVDDAMNWLKTSSKEGDVALLYFAGHGDVEVAALWQLGYLLTYDSPPNNYRNNAIRVEDLDLLAIELSSVRNVRTTFILDACRAGTLAEGRNVPTENLAKQKANEVRILSCKPDQKSAEGSSWGGGRGVFSYYLIRGLQGLANDESNTTDMDAVTAEELADYFRQTVVKDTKSLDPPQRQDPIIVSASETFPLGFVVPEIFTALTNEGSSGDMVMADGTTGGRGMDDDDDIVLMLVQEESPIELLFSTNKDEALIDDMDLPALLALPALEIPVAFMSQFAEVARAHQIDADKQYKLDNFWQLAGIDVQDPEALKAFNLKLAIALHDRGQEIINNYLKADPDDLEERAYYKYETSKYRWYPDIFKMVLKLLPEGHPLRDRLAVKEAYFSGAAIRILAVSLEDRTQAYTDALALQLKALALDDKAPYVHNELGILYRYRKQNDLAEKHFRLAQELAPTWGLPYANLASMLIGEKRLDEAQQMVEKALSLLPEYANAHLIQGRIYEKQNRYLYAEASFLRCTQLAPQHFAGFERLGYLYQQTGEFVMANENFVIAEYLKKNLPISPLDVDMDGYSDVMAPDFYGENFRTEEELLALIQKNPKDPSLYYELGQVYSLDEKYEKAIPRFLTVVELDPEYRIVYDQLAWAYFKVGKYELADQSITLATEHEPEEDGRKMLHALIAESWGRWSEAEKIYHELLSQDSSQVILYQKLGALYERTGRFTEAEEVYFRQNITGPYSNDQELYQFYLRMINRMPGQATWLIRPANLLYNICLRREKNYEVRNEGFEDSFDDPDPSHHLALVTHYYMAWSQPRHVNKHPDLIYWPQVCEKPLSLLNMAFPYLVYAHERADVLQKQGDIQLHLEKRDEAESLYERALTYAPTQDDLRDKIIESYQARYQLPKVREHLAYQDSVGHLRFPTHLKLARMNNLDARFAAGTHLLDKTAGFILDPQQTLRVADLRAQNALLAGDLDKAINLYEMNHAADAGTGANAYSVARIYAKKQDQKTAIKWLDKALKKGFGEYTYVLERDPWMHDLRKTPEWQKCMRG
ncbi:MAG: caspase family protein [Saprospiraceae bacterium]|nr:caspase family protein [Saprospiraceae bacterium]